MTRNNSDDKSETFYSVVGSRVYHEDSECHHLTKANEVKEIDGDEADSLRLCYQCAYDSLSWEEKRKRKRRSRRNRGTTIKIRR